MRTSRFHCISQLWHSQESCRDSFNKFSCTKLFTKFAQAGFYYLNDSIHCFSCHLQTNEWLNIRNPLLFHYLSSPNCSFLQTQSSPEGIFDIQKNYTKNFDTETFICKICFENPIERFLACGHTFCCECLKRVKYCLTCRFLIFNYDEENGGVNNPESG